MGKYHCLTCLHPVALLHTNSIILSCLVEFNPVKLETNCFYSDTFSFKVSECSLFLQTNCQRCLKHLSNQSKRSVQFWGFLQQIGSSQNRLVTSLSRLIFKCFSTFGAPRKNVAKPFLFFFFSIVIIFHDFAFRFVRNKERCILEHLKLHWLHSMLSPAEAV